MPLGDKVVVVTGAASGIGRGVTERFVAVGATVLLLDVSEKLFAVAAEINGACGAVVPFSCDVTSQQSVSDVFERVAGSYGHVDVLVNSAGIEIVASIDELSEADWDRQLDVNLKSMFLCSKYAVPLMRQAGGGSIINIASVLGIIASPHHIAYCASKGGVIQFTKALGLDLAVEGIRVNCILPGPIETPMYRQTIGKLGNVETVHAQLVRSVPLGRIGKCKDIAEATFFLAGDSASFITCSSMLVDGGFTSSHMM